MLGLPTKTPEFGGAPIKHSTKGTRGCPLAKLVVGCSLENVGPGLLMDASPKKTPEFSCAVVDAFTVGVIGCLDSEMSIISWSRKPTGFGSLLFDSPNNPFDCTVAGTDVSTEMI